MDMVKQYGIYWVNLNPTKGSEISKKRPCVVISPKEMNDNLNTIIVAPLTSTIRNYPTRVTVTVNKKKGQIALDQTRTIDKTKLDNKLGVINKSSVGKVKKILYEMFD